MPRMGLIPIWRSTSYTGPVGCHVEFVIEFVIESVRVRNTEMLECVG